MCWIRFHSMMLVVVGWFQVSGVIWADSARLCAVTLGVPIALICSIGAREAEVTAGNILHKLIPCFTLGSTYQRTGKQKY